MELFEGRVWTSKKVWFTYVWQKRLCLRNVVRILQLGVKQATERVTNTKKTKHEQRLSSHMFPAIDENGFTSVLRSYLRGRLARELLEDVAGFSDARHMQITNARRTQPAWRCSDSVMPFSHLLQSLLFRWCEFKTPPENASFYLNGIFGRCFE